MICFRDMTFCTFFDDCKEGNKCERSLTDIKIKQASNVGLPICTYGGKPKCFVDNARPTLEW